jgi:hypothetical protein
MYRTEENMCPEATHISICLGLGGQRGPNAVRKSVSEGPHFGNSKPQIRHKDVNFDPISSPLPAAKPIIAVCLLEYFIQTRRGFFLAHADLYDTDDCAICLEPLMEGDIHLELPFCTHGRHFHANCLTPWLVDNQLTCPMCRSHGIPQPTFADIDDSGTWYMFGRGVLMYLTRKNQGFVSQEISDSCALCVRKEKWSVSS